MVFIQPDYVDCKNPALSFDKSRLRRQNLGTQMKSVGRRWTDVCSGSASVFTNHKQRNGLGADGKIRTAKQIIIEKPTFAALGSLCNL
jgi:ubiquinone/menaquinone biosynthesis C-methylase UbiE